MSKGILAEYDTRLAFPNWDAIQGGPFPISGAALFSYSSSALNNVTYLVTPSPLTFNPLADLVYFQQIGNTVRQTPREGGTPLVLII